jgi:hypothetical protein
MQNRSFLHVTLNEKSQANKEQSLFQRNKEIEHQKSQNNLQDSWKSVEKQATERQVGKSP